MSRWSVLGCGVATLLAECGEDVEVIDDASRPPHGLLAVCLRPGVNLKARQPRRITGLAGGGVG